MNVRTMPSQTPQGATATATTQRRMLLSTKKAAAPIAKVHRFNMKTGAKELVENPKGLGRILASFPRLRMRGRRGREAMEIGALVEAYQNWANDFAPHIRFDVFVSRLEKLAGKIEIKNFVDNERNKFLGIGVDNTAEEEPGDASTIFLDGEDGAEFEEHNSSTIENARKDSSGDMEFPIVSSSHSDPKATAPS